MHMLKRFVYLFPIIFCFIHVSCDQESRHHKDTAKNAKHLPSNKIISKEVIIIDIIPFEDTPPEITNSLSDALRQICPNVTVKDIIPFPENSFYEPRHRYKADSVINYLSSITPTNHVSIGLTVKDISTTKEDISDWGVMGLSFQPGNACIASAFRLDKQNILDQLFKVAIHELGHTQGLDHCEVKTCYMRDAEGKNTTNQEIGFCDKCKPVLYAKGLIKTN